MGISSSQLQPQELVTFKKLPEDVPLDNIEIPERPENRSPTNVKWLIILGTVIIILLPFMIYTLSYADIKRFWSGYDKCGNVCGQNNYHWDNIPCSGKDFTNQPYMQYDSDVSDVEISEDLYLDRYCVQSCTSGYIIFLRNCIKGTENEYSSNSSQEQEVSSVKYEDSGNPSVYFASVKWQIIVSCLLSILVAIGMLFLFRYAVAFVVWGIIIGSYTGLLILVVAVWSDSGFHALTVILTIIAIVLGLMLRWCRNKITLVIMLLKEATKAVFDMPRLITLPVICVVAISFLTFLFVITTFYMATAGTLEPLGADFYYYVSSPVMTFTMFYNVVVYLWLTQFFTGIQYMVIAGAVSKWYFSRDKSFLGSPILTSKANTFRFHLGSVALGGLIITTVQLIKSVVLGLISNKKIRAVVQHYIEKIETLFKFLSKNSYIITAMHGQAFLRSGERAAKLIIQNIKDIIAVNYIGDFVLGMAKLLIVVVTILLSMAIFAIAPGEVSDSNLLAYVIIAIVSCVVACVSFGVFETTIDTIFICYCEDNLLNDGMARPYFMSRNLMEFVQSSKEIYAKKYRENSEIIVDLGYHEQICCQILEMCINCCFFFITAFLRTSGFLEKRWLAVSYEAIFKHLKVKIGTISSQSE